MSRSPAPTSHRAAFVVIALCWAIVVFDGYDLIVYGTVLPHLLDEPGWGLTTSVAGLLGSLAFAGMLVGAVLAGALCDRLGRRGTIIGCAAWFSLFTALCALATGPATFGVLRFLAGLGLGGLVPSANALAAEFVDRRHRPVVSTLMMSGVPVGGGFAALIGIVVLPRFGWEAMFVIALVPLLVVVPVCLRFLPESPEWLRAHGRPERAATAERRFRRDDAPVLAPAAAPQGLPLGALLGAPYRGATIAFSCATVVTLFAWYGLATWLPQLMRESGFDLGSALTFVLALSFGAVLGSLATAWGGTRIGPVKTAALAAAAAAAGLAVLLTHPATVVAYAALILAGVGTHGTQCLIIAAVANHYPAHLRGSALGFSLGFGRIGAVLAPQVGGLLLAAGLGVNSNFLVFAIAAGIAGVLLLATPRRATEAPARVPALKPETVRA